MSYQIGERVWAFSEGAWFPAKVVDGAVYATPHNENEVVVKYYSGEAEAGGFIDVLETNMVTPYEESSEKAATLDPAMLAAMEAAKNDSDALPLREDPTSFAAAAGSKRPRGDDSGAATATKHHRRERESDAAHASNTATASSSKAVTVMRAQSDLVAAADAGNIIGVRRALLKLAAMPMSYAILRETKVGVTVADLLGLAAFKPLHPLAKAVVCDWARKLPADTIRAIKHELETSTVQ